MRSNRSPAVFRTAILENGLDVPGVGHAGGEDQARVAILRVLDNLPAGRLDQFVLIHEILDLAGDELSATLVKPGGVDLLQTRLGDKRAEIALRDQFLHPHLVADGVQKVFGVADHARFEPVGRSGQADQPNVRVDHLGIGQELPIRALPVIRALPEMTAWPVTAATGFDAQQA